MSLPPKAILFKDLELIKSDESTAKGTHTINTMLWHDPASSTDESTAPTVFFKPLVGDYTEERAKYVALSSILLQLTLGKHAARERLVYDIIPGTEENPQYKIIGTVSFALPNFSHMLYSNETEPSDQEKLAKIKPSFERLINAPEIAAILMTTYLYGDDDLHPGNIGICFKEILGKITAFFARIDLDRYLGQGSKRTIAGYLLGVPRDSQPIAPDYLKNFPNGLVDGHMPSNEQSPHAWSAEKKFPGYECFQNLARDNRFHRQMMTSALKVLLMYQPEVIRQHLIDQLDEDDPFIDKAMKELKDRYNDIYRNTVFYEGCAKNDWGARVPSFEEFLDCTPSAYREILKSVQEYNAEMEEEHGSEKSPAYKIDESALEQFYHYIWRNSKTQQINRLCLRLHELVMNTQSSIPEMESLLKITPAAKELDDAEEASDLLTTFELLAPQRSAMSSSKIHESNKLKEAVQNLAEFTTELSSFFNTYIQLPRSELSREKNVQLLKILQDFIHKYDPIRKAIYAGLGNATFDQTAFQDIYRSIDALSTAMGFIKHIDIASDTDFGCDPIKLTTPSIARSHVDSEVVKGCIHFLFNWVDTLPPDEFRNKLNKIIAGYKPNIRAASYRVRDEKVLPYLENSKENPGHQLAMILGHGGTIETSLNTAIIETLVPEMLEDNPEAIDFHLPHVRAQLKKTNEEGFKWTVYAEYAQKMLRDTPELSPALSAFHKTIYAWAEKLDTDKKIFEKIITENVLNHHNTWTSGWFSSVPLIGSDRKAEIINMLKDKEPNAKILAKMLDGKEDSTMTSKTFEFLWDLLREQSRQKVMAEVEGSTTLFDPVWTAVVSTEQPQKPPTPWESLFSLDSTAKDIYKPVVQKMAKIKLAEFEKSLVTASEVSVRYLS